MIDWNSDKTRVEFKEIESYLQMYGRGSRVVRWAYAYRRFRNKVYYGLQQQFAGWFRAPKLDKSRLHVLLHSRGGIGDCCAHRVCVQALRQKLPNAVFYYYTDAPEAATILFEADEKNVLLDSAKVPYRRAYDMACELCVSFKIVYVNQKRVAALAPEFCDTLKNSLARQKSLSFFLSDNYLLDDALGRFLYHHRVKWLEGERYLSALEFDVNETGLLPECLLKRDISHYGLQKPYITIHSGINASFRLHGKQPLKCWPEEKWREFVKLFKQKFPQIQVVQLGGKNSPHFDFVDVCLVGKSPLQDLPALIENACLHIDGESGLVQLTRWLRTKTVVLFANTDAGLFGLTKNKNLSVDVCGKCMWLQGPAWHTDCILGYPTCKNLEAISPTMVFQAVSEELAAQGF